MFIECLIRREGPTHVTIAGFDYVFTLNKHGAKVCRVMSKDHQQHLLHFKDYRPYTPPENEAPVVPAKPLVSEPEMLVKRDGNPYTSEKAAIMAAKSRGHDVAKVKVVELPEGGFAAQVW